MICFAFFRVLVLLTMELNTILVWTVAISCGVSAVQAVQLNAHRGHLCLSLGLLLLLGGLFWRDPATAGLIAGSAWCLLQVLPRLLHGGVNVLLGKKQYVLARLLARLFALLQPFDGSFLLPRLMTAMQCLNSGQGERALELLNGLQSSPTSVGRMALGLRTRLTGQWQSFLDQISDEPASLESSTDPLLVETYLQSLGETHRRSELLREYQRLVERRLGQIAPVLVTVNEMKLAAFCGEVLMVSQLQNLLGTHYPADVKQFWIATAMQVAGQPSESGKLLAELAERDNLAVANAAERRLQCPLPALVDQPLTSEEVRILSGIERRVGAVMLDQAFRKAHPPWATRILLMLIMGMFLLEIPGGSENYDNLHQLGAMIVPVDWDSGEWWRPITAAFLHFGLLHLGLNALGLAALGPQLERLWGSLRLMVTYLCAAVGGIAFAPFLMEPIPDGLSTMILGASGGVMGLVGGLCLQAGVMVWKGRTPSLLTQFLLLLLVIVVQIVFDQMTPNISGEAHLLGLGIGVGFASIWNLTSRVRT